MSAGDEVQAGELLGKLDDRQALIEQETAETQLQIAIERATRDRSPELAGQRLADAKQTTKEHSMLVEIAERNADNETRVLAAIKSQAVAKNELDRAIRAREQFVDSVSQSEIDGLQLTFEKTRLDMF